MRPTREMRPRAILTSGLGGTISGSIGSNFVVSYASNTYIDDVDNYYEATNVETALAELAAKVVGYQAHGNTGATETFDAAVGWHSATLNAATVTFTLTANPTGTVSSLFLELLQDGTGGRVIDLPASVTNAAELEAAQVTTAGTTSLLVLLSRDGGTNWFGGWWGGSGSASIDYAEAADIAAIGSAAAAGVSAEVPRADHVHELTAALLTSMGVRGEILISDTPSNPIVYADLLLNDDQTDFLYADLLELP